MSDEVIEIPVEQVIETKIENQLKKFNVTDAVLAEFKERAAALKINGIDDKEGYNMVHDVRMDLVKLRTATIAFCKKGREDATLERNMWIEREKKIVARIKEIEDPLDAMETEIDNQKKEIERKRQQAQRERLLKRHAELTGMGVLYSGGFFMLDTLQVEEELVAESDEDIYQNSIYMPFKALYDKHEAERNEHTRKQKEQEEELAKQKRDMDEQRAAMDREKKELEDTRETNRTTHLIEMGFLTDRSAMVGFDITIPYKVIRETNESEWKALMVGYAPKIAQAKEKIRLEKEKKDRDEQARKDKEARDREIFNLSQQRAAMLKTIDCVYPGNDLGELCDEDFDVLYNNAKTDYEKKQQEKWQKEKDDADAKRKQEEQDKMDATNDKEKWQAFTKAILQIKVPVMKNPTYKSKATKAEGFLGNIINL